MATAKTARVVRAQDHGGARRLHLAMVDPPALEFLGGQYIIVDSGRILPNGKAAKRAYSILSADAVSGTFELAVKRIATDPLGGLGSGYLHGVVEGEEIRFSGAWGKLHPGVLAPEGPVLVVATDTGITAALGLVRGRGFTPVLGATAFAWLRTGASDFLPEADVRALLPAGLARVLVVDIAPVGTPERGEGAVAALSALLAAVPRTAYLTGDGHVLQALHAALVAAAVDPARIALEPFFNAPKKSE